MMIDNKEIMILDEQSLKEKVYWIRNQQVMLDYDLAQIYGYTTTRFNEQIARNIDRFEDDFMFQLTKEEFQILEEVWELYSKISDFYQIKQFMKMLLMR
jgi:hypothetical protein